MDRTQAYQCFGTNDSLPESIERMNKYRLDLRLLEWITQKQYEQLNIKPDEVELAHLYYLSKAHKPSISLRLIIAGLKHPIIKISKSLDDLLIPSFDRMAGQITINSGDELVVQLENWSNFNLQQETVLFSINVADLYTMAP